MNIPPVIDRAYSDLPADPTERHRFLSDAFGKYLLWAMQKSEEDVKRLVESEPDREKMGRVPAQPFKRAAEALNHEQKQVTYALTREALALFARRLLGILTAQGVSHRLGTSHAIQFRLVLEIRDVENLDLIDEEVINRGGDRAFFTQWGRWLRQNQPGGDAPANNPEG
jgi:hypothetical protein